MKEIDKYIIEKLHLNKDIKVFDWKSFHWIKSIIVDYLDEHSWFDTPRSKFDFYKEDNNIIFEIPNDRNCNALPLIKSIGKELIELINDKIEQEIYYSIEDNKIYFSFDII